MKIDVLTLFPEMFISPLGSSMIKRALDKGLVDINCIDIRDYAENKHMQADDYPYGGGAGMVMKADVVIRALDAAKSDHSWAVYMSPQGRPLTQTKVKALAEHKHLLILCGHYEGIDDRIRDRIDEEISVGDYILTGGELPALVVIDAVVRLLPGVLGDYRSSQEDSFAHDLLEYPQFTRPLEVGGIQVPQVLVSGHHENIRVWRKKQSLLTTLLKRPELLLNREYDREERRLLEEILFAREQPE